jgi:ApaG protein
VPLLPPNKPVRGQTRPPTGLAERAVAPQAFDVEMSEAITRYIRVQVQSHYMPERSAPPRHQWFFAYKIRITNEGEETIQLLTRHWVITDATGRVEEVNGEGVVGEQPVIEPGHAFEYSSGCPLTTPFGSMHGAYQMINRLGEQFDVTIPAFVLRIPGSMN